MPFPLPAPDAAAESQAFAKADPSLLFHWEDQKVHRHTQVAFLIGGFVSAPLFSRYGNTEQEVRDGLKEDFGLAKEDGLAAKAEISKVILAWHEARSRTEEATKAKAEARATKTLHVIEAGDLAIMRRAYESLNGSLDDAEVPSQTVVSKQLEKLETNFVEAHSLTEVTCVQDKEEELLQSKLDTSGHIKVQRVTAKIPPPRDGEELRNRHKRLALSWLFASQKHGTRAWLAGTCLGTFEHLSTYILGERVAALRAQLPDGSLTQAPPWPIVLSYEFQIRKEAARLVMLDSTLHEAIRTASKDTELRQRYFMDILTMAGTASRAAFQRPISLVPNGSSNMTAGSSGQRPRVKGKQKRSQRQLPYNNSSQGSPSDALKSACGNFWLRHPQVTNSNGGKQQICMKFNKGTCIRDDCPAGRAHFCLKCLGRHAWPECSKFEASMPFPDFGPSKGSGKGKKK